MSHLQGPVPLNDSSYVSRPFEQRLIKEMWAGRWLLLLGPRQHGKTSALVRARKHLAESGLPTALIDLQAAPPHETYEEFIKWFCYNAQDQLCNGGDADSLQGHDLGTMLAAALPDGIMRIAIIVDEASNIKDIAWRNSFYGQLRAISSRRAHAQAHDAAARLLFIFAGTFRPETLIDEANSPFNVCERIDTEDLSASDVATMTGKVLGDGSEELARAIFSEVGGQPFLIQKLLSRLEGDGQDEDLLTSQIEELRTGQSDHIGNLFSKVLADAKLAAIATKLVRDGAVPIEAADPDHRYMQVLGIAQRVTNKLEFRNALYAHVAASSPQLGGQPTEQRRAPMFPLPIGAFSKVRNSELQEIAWRAHTGAIAAYHGGSNRLALAGFGGSLEAMLLDLMLRQIRGTLPGLIQQAGCNLTGLERANDPKTWRLVNLIKAAQKVQGRRPVEPPQALRDWRNTIHPSVCLDNYRPDIELEPEVRAASALHDITLRDLP